MEVNFASWLPKSLEKLPPFTLGECGGYVESRDDQHVSAKANIVTCAGNEATFPRTSLQ